MSIFDELFGAFSGSDASDFTPPTTLCPGDCPLGPGACGQCRPYKEKLKEALYNVDHLDAFLARYEVTGGQSTGATTCPHCGAPSENPFVCEYCGMQIREDDGKIRVASANDIPDPILEAQNIIFERHSAIVGRAEETAGAGDLPSSLLVLLGGAMDTSDGLGKRMTKEEIAEAAKSYGVSVSAYLNGLDNGKYLTWEEKKRSSASGFGAGGMLGAGLGGAALGSLLRGNEGVSGMWQQGTQRRPEPPRAPWEGMFTQQPTQPRRTRTVQPQQPRQPQPTQQARREEPLRQPTQQPRREEPLRQPTQSTRREEPLRQPRQSTRREAPLRQPQQANRISAEPRVEKQERREAPKGGGRAAADSKRGRAEGNSKNKR